MKRPPESLARSRGILLLLALGLAAARCGRPALPRDERSGPSGRAASGDASGAPPVAVRVAALRRGPISSTLETTGDLEAEDWTELVVRRAGVVEKLHVEEGARVHAGDPLLELDRREAEILLDQARNEEVEARQRAELAAVKAEEAQNAVDQARIAAEKAADEYTRYRQLTRGVIQQEELKTREYERNRTRLQLEAAEGAQRQARLDAAIARTVAETAVLRRTKAEIDLDFTVLRAPFDGVISARHVQRGQYLPANTPAFTLVNGDSLKLEVNLPQRYLPRLRPGLDVALRTEAFRDRVFPATLERVSPVVGEKGTVKVTIRVQHRDRRLRPGLYVSATLVLDTHPRALLASKRGVQYDTLGGGPAVFAVRGGRAVRLPVRIGYRAAAVLEVIPVPVAAGYVSIAPGPGLFGAAYFQPARFTALAARDRIIVAGQDRLKGGEAVKVVSEAGAGPPAPGDPSAPPDSRARPRPSGVKRRAPPR